MFGDGSFCGDGQGVGVDEQQDVADEIAGEHAQDQPVAIRFGGIPSR